MNCQLTVVRAFVFFFGSLLLIVSISCTETARKKDTKPDTGTAKKPASTFSDTLTINFPAAVFYSPDSLQLERIKLVTDPMIFDGSQHEYYYLMRNAKMAITKTMPRLKIMDVRNIQYLFFVRDSAQISCIDLNRNNDAYGLFLFDGQKAPRFCDMANIDTELGHYFSK